MRHIKQSRPVTQGVFPDRCYLARSTDKLLFSGRSWLRSMRHERRCIDSSCSTTEYKVYFFGLTSCDLT